MKPHHKNKKSKEEIPSMEDRLSDLPEPILHHIFSFLNMRYATPTSLLSKKYRHIYTSLPSLKFDREFLKTCLLFTNVSNGRYHTNAFSRSVDLKFIKFVNQVLGFCRTESINSFRLYWGHNGICKSINIESWLNIVVSKNVQEIDVQISTENDCFVLPEALFTSKFLTSLKLVLGSRYPEQTLIIPTPEAVDLPALRNLSLTKVNYVRDELLDVYFNGCPVLERLSLISCNLDSDQRLTFAAPQLKHLVFESLDRVSWYKKCSKCIVVSALNLVSFTCKGYVCDDFSLENLNLLEVANIQMRTADRDYNEEDFDWEAPEFTVEDTMRMMKLLKGLYNVKYLTCNATFLQVISEAPDVLNRSYTPLSNLRYLKLITRIGKAYLRSILYLLENSPNVETLILEIDSVIELPVNIAEYWGEEMVLVEKLKEIQIWNSERCVDFEPKRLKEYLKHEIDLLKMFLKYGVKLEKMKIFFYAKWSSEDEEVEGVEEIASPRVSSEVEEEVVDEIMECFQEEILACPRASSNVTILFRQRNPDCW